MNKKLRFLLSGIMSFTLMSSSLAIISALPFETKAQTFKKNFTDESIFYNNLKNEIVNNSYDIKGEQYYKLDDETFYSERDLEQGIFANGDLKSFSIMSKPEDIYLDVAHGILDPKKIEYLNLDDYIPVYRTLYNQAVFKEDDALNSFANETNLHKEYSYDKVH